MFDSPNNLQEPENKIFKKGLTSQLCHQACTQHNTSESLCLQSTTKSLSKRQYGKQNSLKTLIKVTPNEICTEHSNVTFQEGEKRGKQQSTSCGRLCFHSTSFSYLSLYQMHQELYVL